MSEMNSEPSDVNQSPVDQYAQAWVEHLKSRNRMLTISMAILGLVVVGLAAGMVSNYLDKTALTRQLDGSIAQVSLLDGRLNAEIARSQGLEKKLDEVSQTKEFLEQLKGDTASQLAISNEMIAAQSQKIALLESESQMLRAATEELEVSGISKDQRNVALNMQIAALKEDLSKRKTAYLALAKRNKETQEEMNRLSGLVGNKEAEIAKLASGESRHLATIKSLKRDIQKLELNLNAMQVRSQEADSRASAYQEINLEPAAPTVLKDPSGVNHRSLASQPIVGTPSKVTNQATQIELGTKAGEVPVVDPNKIQLD